MLRAPKAPGARQDGSRRAPRQASIPAKRLGRSSSRLDAAPGGVVDLKYRSCSTTRPSRRPTANREELRARTRWANFTIRRTKTTIGCEYAEGSTASGYIQSFGDAVATIPYAGPTAICDSAISPPARVPTNSARRGQSRSTRPKMRATTTTKVIEVDRERRTRPPGPTPGPPPMCRRRPSRPRRGICSMAWR